jgi:predicted membrane protein
MVLATNIDKSMSKILLLILAACFIFVLAASLPWLLIITIWPDMDLDNAFSIIFYTATGVTALAVFYLRKTKPFRRKA